jgi:ribosomal protein S18 acetylase RimI-like enzyme
MPRIASVDPAQLHAAFLEAFADYAMDASGTTEEKLLLRMQKNAVDYDLSPGLYDEDRLVGFTLIGVDEWGGVLTAYDAGTGIVPRFRRLGWARKLFDHALPALREQGVERFALEVLRGNEPAIKAYEKSGFEIVRELRCFVAKVEDLAATKDRSEVEIRGMDRATLSELEASADWLPSFENRFSAVDGIRDHIQLSGAFDGELCVGATAYSPPLNWLLTLLVDEKHRRRGIGTTLIRHLAATLPASVSQMRALNVDAEDTGMQVFLQSIGFEHLVDQYEMLRDI